MAADARILIVDDDAVMVGLLSQHLTRQGFIVRTAQDSETCRARLDDTSVDLIILDVMLGLESGFDLCREIRARTNIPILFLSALSAEHHRIRGLGLGADDYLCKPFNPEELLLRLKAILRRTGHAPELRSVTPRGRWTFSNWTLEASRNLLISPAGVRVPISMTETKLLLALMAHPMVPLTREELAEAVNNTSPDGSRAIDLQISRLRRKVEADSARPVLIQTVRGAGYKLASQARREDI